MLNEEKKIIKQFRNNMERMRAILTYIKSHFHVISCKLSNPD
jgi:hypothetical protein